MEKRRFEDGTVMVRFGLPAAVEATSVSVCGDFNGWEPRTHPLLRLGDGSFRTEIPLPAGDRWRFRYLLDGRRWENDWAADDYAPNGLGDDNSIVDLTETGSLPLVEVALLDTGAGAGSGDDPSPGSPGTSGPSRAEAAAVPGGRHGLLRRWWRRLTGGPRRAADDLVGSPS